MEASVWFPYTNCPLHSPNQKFWKTGRIQQTRSKRHQWELHKHTELLPVSALCSWLEGRSGRTFKKTVELVTDDPTCLYGHVHMVPSFLPAAGACHLPGTASVFPDSTATQLGFLNWDKNLPFFSFPPFQQGSWSNNCENGSRKTEIIWPEAGGGKRKKLPPFRDSNVVLLAQLSLGPQASLLFRGILMDKSNSPPSDYSSIMAQHCSQGCQSEEAFGFLISWHFTGHTSALISVQICHKTHLCSDLSCHPLWNSSMPAWQQLSTDMLQPCLNRYLRWYLEEKRTPLCHHWSEHIPLLTLVCQAIFFLHLSPTCLHTWSIWHGSPSFRSLTRPS